MKNRGPDAYSTVTKNLTKQVLSKFTGFTLHFQGLITTQPLLDDESNALLWNGEVFGGVEVNFVLKL